MSWYNAGTITATNGSGTLTGTGTAFITNIRVGDGVTLAGSTSLHEVTNIVSETQITVSPVYGGTTGAGKAYSVVPVQGYIHALADQAKALILSFNSVAASASLLAMSTLTPAANTLPYFTSGSAASTTPLSAAARSLLDDASVTDMRTTLDLILQSSVTDSTPNRVLKTGSFGLGAMGNDVPLITDVNSTWRNGDYRFAGTATGAPNSLPGSLTVTNLGGNFIQQLARCVPGSQNNPSLYYRQFDSSGTPGAWVGLYHNANIVGAVSQSTGLPTGAIMEYGTNANGEYWKFASGLMIASRTYDLTYAVQTALGSLFYYGGTANNGTPGAAMPVTFIAAPKIAMNVTGVSTQAHTGWISGLDDSTTTMWPRFYHLDCFSRTSTTYRIHCTAIGRWF